MQGLFGAGASDQAGQRCPARQPLDETDFPSGTAEEEKSTILAMLRKRADGAPASVRKRRVSALAWAGLRLAAMVLLVAGVGVAAGDGDDDLDDAGAAVAQGTMAGCYHSKPGKDRPDEDEKVRRGAGDGTGGDPPSLTVRRGECEDASLQMADARGGARSGQFILRKGLGGWRLVFDGQERVLPDEKGVGYVAALLLDPPPEPIHASELANRAFGDAVVEGQRNLGIDDQETLGAMRKARRKCQAVIDDQAATDIERQEARTELESIDDWARKHLRGSEGNEQRQVRSVRQAIRRFLAALASSQDPLLHTFGQHLHRCLWRPSSPGPAGRRGRVRTQLAGRFTYQPPDGVRWTT